MGIQNYKIMRVCRVMNDSLSMVITKNNSVTSKTKIGVCQRIPKCQTEFKIHLLHFMFDY